MFRRSFGELKELVWKNLGEPDDLAPYYDSENIGVNRPIANAVSDLLIGEFVNRALVAVSIWEDNQTQRKFRWKGSRGLYHIYGEQEEGTVVSGTKWVIETSSGVTYQEGDVVEIGRSDGTYSDTRYVMDVSGTTITLSEDLSEDPVAGDYIKRYPVRFNIADSNIIEFQKFDDLVNNTELTRFDRSETDLFNLENPGTPTKWDKRGDYVYFDIPVEGRYRFRAHTINYPRELTVDTAHSEMPDFVETAVMFKASELGYLYMNEEVSASVMMGNVNKVMRNTQDEWDMDSDMETGYNSSVEAN